jgi:hypothetical protein
MRPKPAQTISNIKPVKKINLQTWQSAIEENVKTNLPTQDDLKIEDINWRLKNRQQFQAFLIRLLVFQNIIVFSLFGIGLVFNKLQGLENAFTVLIGGTLAETVALIQIIVKWLYSEIPYEKHSAVKSA